MALVSFWGKSCSFYSVSAVCTLWVQCVCSESAVSVQSECSVFTVCTQSVCRESTVRVLCVCRVSVVCVQCIQCIPCETWHTGVSVPSLWLCVSLRCLVLKGWCASRTPETSETSVRHHCSLHHITVCLLLLLSLGFQLLFPGVYI